MKIKQLKEIIEGLKTQSTPTAGPVVHYVNRRTLTMGNDRHWVRVRYPKDNRERKRMLREHEDISELAIKSHDDMKALKAHCKQMDQDRAEALAVFDKKVVAYGCAEEAKGGRCCPDWCMSDSCLVTFEDSLDTPQTKEPK